MIDDKITVIVTTFLLGVFAMFVLKDAEIVKLVVTGLFGVAVGKSIS